MTVILTEPGHARYRDGVRDYLDASPRRPSTTSRARRAPAPAGQPCTTGDGWRCVSRLVDQLERVDLHRVAAHEAGLRAAQTTSAALAEVHPQESGTR